MCADAAQKIGLLTELCPLGSMAAWARADAEASLALDWARRVRVASHVARALEGVHAQGLVHRDVAAKNVLMRAGADGEVEALLADFGLVRELEAAQAEQAAGGAGTRDQKTLTLCGTESTMSPEMTLGMPYTSATDVFSFGVVLGELMGVAKPKRKLPMFTIDWAFWKKAQAPDVPPPFLKIAQECCSKTPERRPAMGVVAERLEALAQELEAAGI